MKSNGKKKLIGAAALAVMLCTGCGASGAASEDIMATEMKYESDSSYSMGANNYISMDYENGVYGDGGPVEEAAPAAANQPELMEARKLIETVSLEVETKEFEQLMQALEIRIQELGGYVEDMDTYNGSAYFDYGSMRRANMTVRIPNEQLDTFLNTVSEAGNIVRRSGNVKDVTLSYVDMESRRNTLRTEQSRLLEFLDRAETIEEIITIEERLSEVRYQLESMESQLRTLDNQVDFSTIYISISEVRDLTPVEEPTIWERITEGFQESLGDIGNGTLEFGIWFVVHIPYLILWGIGIGIVVLFIRKHRINKKKKLEERMRIPVPPVWEMQGSGEQKESRNEQKQE